MVTIIHGDDVVSSRAFLNEQKSKAEAIQSFSNNFTLTDLVLSLEGSLFGTEVAVFIENLLGRKKSKEKEEIITYLSKQKNLKKVFLWEDAEIPLKTLQLFAPADIKTYKLPKLLFTFVDSIKPNVGKQLVIQFHELLTQTDVDFVFAMIVRQFRLLLAVSEPDSIEEIKRLGPWQITKLNKQRSYFTETKLLSCYNNLFSIDNKLKTGTLSLTLVQAIDFFLINL